MPKLFLLLLVRLALLCAFFICDDQSYTSGQKFNIFFICCSYGTLCSSKFPYAWRQKNTQRICKERILYVFLAPQAITFFIFLRTPSSTSTRFAISSTNSTHFTSAKHYQHTLSSTTSLQLRYIIALVVPLIHLTVNASSFLNYADITTHLTINSLHSY